MGKEVLRKVQEEGRNWQRTDREGDEEQDF